MDVPNGVKKTIFLRVKFLIAYGQCGMKKMIKTPELRRMFFKLKTRAAIKGLIMNREQKFGCDYCKCESVPGWIKTDNNGPIVPCPICNWKEISRQEYEKNRKSK